MLWPPEPVQSEVMRSHLRTALIALFSWVLVAWAPAALLAKGGQDELLKKADTIAQSVSRLRGLKQKTRIKRGVMQKDEIRKRLIERVDDEYSPEEIRAEELAMKRLGLLPADADYKKLVIDLLTEQIAGFYDPVERQLYIAGWQQTGVEMFDDILMAHEIDHALQDQHFGLRTFMKLDRANSDATVARQALVEGDGTALMFEFMMNKMGVEMPWADQKTMDMMSKQMSTAMAGAGLGNIPLVLREGLVFPYMEGLRFVAHFRKHHPWKRVDEIYRKPPLSTEHILHPAAYEAYERPDEITVGEVAVLKGYRLAYSNVNGELGLSFVLRQHAGPGMEKRGEVYTPEEKAGRAVAGWGGDRLAVYTPPGHTAGLAGTVGVSYSVWDQTADAIEFFEMLSNAMASLSRGKAVKDTEDLIEYADDRGNAFVAQRRDDAVVIVLGAKQGQAAEILGQVWKTWKVKRR